MSARATTLEQFAIDDNYAEFLVLDFAEHRGQAGFTVEDLRTAIFDGFPKNPGSVLGRLCASGKLRRISDEPARARSSKGRRVARFILTGAT